MSVTDINKVDMMGVSPDGKELCLLITDHLDWEDEGSHLLILQDKINAYLAFLEEESWKEQFPGEYENLRIEIVFVHEITQNCEKFLQAVQDQVGQYGIRIRAVIADDGLRSKLTQEADTTPKKSGFRFPFFKKRDK